MGRQLARVWAAAAGERRPPPRLGRAVPRPWPHPADEDRRGRELSPEEARKAARKILAKVEVGHDPQAEKAVRRQQDGHTLAAVVADYLNAKLPMVRRNTYREMVRYLTGPHFKPLHAQPLDQITRRDVAFRLTKIVAENGSITAGARARYAVRAVCLGDGAWPRRDQPGGWNDQAGGR